MKVLDLFCVLNVFLIFICFSNETNGSFKFDDWSVKADEIRKEYDYIIVGSGSTGSRLANKLSSRKDLQILVLEAGSTPPDYSEIPGFASVAERTEYDWNYQILPQNNSFLAYVNKSKNFPSGKVVGGGSIVNSMSYQRGNRYDYDNWSKQFGAKGWEYDAVLPLFMEDEANNDFRIVSSKYHGRNGSLCVSSTKFRTPVLSAFLNGGKELGYKISDVNDGDNEGFFEDQTTTCDGVIRCSSAKAFIQSIVQTRNNLHLSLKSMVTKVLFDGKRAIGVIFERNGQKRSVYATREIIISAGAFRSPQLLMLSGIGPKKELDKWKIPVLADLPVGENYQDHVTVIGLFGVGPSTWQMDMTDSAALLEYYHYGTGSLTSPSGNHLGVAYVRTKYATDNVPDIELLGLSAINTLQSIPIKTEWLQKFYAKVGNQGMYSILPVVMHPKSKGWIRLSSTNIYDQPLINPNYLEDKLDLRRLVEGMKVVEKLIRSKPFQKLNITLYENPFPPCEKYAFGTNAYYYCLARYSTINAFHASGTCRMGDASRNDTVVDERLRVKGVERLRVADASIMPQLVTGHLNAPCIMIGSKAGDLILQDMVSVLHTRT